MDRRPVYLDEVITEIRRIAAKWAGIAEAMGGDGEIASMANGANRVAFLLEDFDPMERPWRAR